MTTTVNGGGQLPLFSIPDRRRDYQIRLAALFRDICYNHARPGGCVAGNAFLASQCGVSRGHLPALLADLRECGLIEVQLTKGNVRQIVPRVDLVTVMRSGWQALWHAVLARDKFPAALRRLAQWLSDRDPQGKPDLEKMGLRETRIPISKSWRTGRKSGEATKLREGLEPVIGGKTASSEAPEMAPETPKTAQNSEGSLKGSLKGFPIKEHRREASTSTEIGVRAEPAPAPNADPAAVLLLTQIGLQNAEAKALAVGVKQDGGTLEQLQHAVSVALTSSPRNFGGFVRSAVRAAVSGAAYLKPASTSAKEERERPQRVVEAPITVRTASRAEREQEEAQKQVNAAWEGLPGAEKDRWLSVALREVLGEVSGLAHKGVTKRGKEHPIVVARAKKLAGNEPCAMR